MKIIFLILVILASARASSAQELVRADGSPIRTGPITTKDRVSFRLDNMTLQNAMAMPVRIRVDNSALTAPFDTLVPPRTCERAGGNTYRCENYVPQGTVNRVNVPGKHAIYAFTFDGNCCESVPSSPWTLTTPK